MNTDTKIKIGLFGFGVVGHGLYDILSKSKGFQAEIIKIAVKDKTKKRSLSEHFFTFDKNELLNNHDDTAFFKEAPDQYRNLLDGILRQDPKKAGYWSAIITSQIIQEPSVNLMG